MKYHKQASDALEQVIEFEQASKEALKKIARIDELVKETKPFIGNKEYSSFHVLRADTVFPNSYGKDIWCFYAVGPVNMGGILDDYKKFEVKTEEIAEKMKEVIDSGKDVTSFHATLDSAVKENGKTNIWNIYVLEGKGEKIK